ncbi:hypothetical protein QYE76_027485 [Lolium multiflorum]|uniref:inositol-1,3,4-trisphosphate 5/6-kinase n=1 Tax=Lolium multiflorum TaxID=4521 RepID=A0AAD8VDM2_LOLMU|nr:hypothetical protein QYE76_027485 [Lolium multiflorum]
MPPPGLVDEVARGLRRVLGLHLFNFDMIRGRKAAGGGGQYFIIDINYFSGFDKLPGYEVALTDFFDEMIRSPHTGSGRFYRRRNASKLFCGGAGGVSDGDHVDVLNVEGLNEDQLEEATVGWVSVWQQKVELSIANSPWRGSAAHIEGAARTIIRFLNTQWSASDRIKAEKKKEPQAPQPW